MGFYWCYQSYRACHQQKETHLGEILQQYVVWTSLLSYLTGENSVIPTDVQEIYCLTLLQVSDFAFVAGDVGWYADMP